MKPKTMILMVVAVACGLGASYMTSKLLADRKPAETPQTVPVLVAKVRVPGWVQIKEPEKYFEIKQYPPDVAPPGALDDIAQVKDQRFNKFIDQGKPVTQPDLLTKEQQDLATQIKPGQRAIAIKVNAESQVAGFVLPGTRVDIVMTMRGNDPSSKMILQKMLVLAVDTQDQTATGKEMKTIIGQTVTFAATPEEAMRLSLATSIGELRLILNGHGDEKVLGKMHVHAKDLDKPLKVGEDTAADTAAETPTPSFPVPPLDEKKVETPPAPAPAVKPIETPRRKKAKVHVMQIINGSKVTKARFPKNQKEDDADDDDDTPAKPDASARDPKVDPEPAPKTPAPDPTPAPAPAGRSKSVRSPGSRGPQ